MVDEQPVTVDAVGGDELRIQRRRSQQQHYKIQEVIKRRRSCWRVSKEERGNKGAMSRPSCRCPAAVR